jgi:hypothetical protein
VVKLVDVYPDEVATEPKMGGYQLMVSADIFREDAFAKAQKCRNPCVQANR